MVSEWSDTLPTVKRWRFHDDSGHARQLNQYLPSPVLEYLVRGWTLMTLSGISPDMSASVHEPVRSNRYDPFGMSLDENRVRMRVPVTIMISRAPAAEPALETS